MLEKEPLKNSCCAEEELEEKNTQTVCCDTREEHVKTMTCCSMDKEENEVEISPKRECEAEEDCCSHSDGEAHNHQEKCCDKDRQKTCKKGENKIASENSKGQERNQKTFRITGMDCHSCAVTIEKHLRKCDKITDVSVNFSTATMTLQGEVSPSFVKKELKKIGYDGQLESDNGSESKFNPKDWFLPLTSTLLLVGAVLTRTSIPVLADLLFICLILICGFKPFRSAYYAIRSRSLDMNVLMVTASIGAFILKEYSEASMVLYLYMLGMYLQTKAVDKSRNSIQNLLEKSPGLVYLKSGNEFVECPIETVKLGDTILVKPGNLIPLDGVILSGNSSINQSAITGESVPVEKGCGDQVYAGTLNNEGGLEVKVEHLKEDTVVAKIVQLVNEAQAKKSPTELFIDKFASVYTPVVFVLAIFVTLIPPLLFGAAWSTWFYRSLELLVVACPCALVISTPVTIVSAIGAAAKRGVLLKGGQVLEKISKINTITFDKTGTLTQGKPSVTDIKTFGISENASLEILSGLETKANHPLANAITELANERGLRAKSANNFESIVGKGIKATIDGQVYLAGNLELFTDHVNEEVMTFSQKLKAQGRTLIALGTSERVLAIYGLADVLRAEAIDTIKDLKNNGVQSFMLTGDNEIVANNIGQELGMTKVYANLLPQDKLKIIEEKQADGQIVAMVGDGVNDSPALALSDVGIAMGVDGTDAAIEVADVILMVNDLKQLPKLVGLSHSTMAILKQNITFSLMIKIISFIFIFPGWLTLWMAVLADSGAAILVTLNSLRLLKKK